jgi:hypothetical protein
MAIVNTVHTLATTRTLLVSGRGRDTVSVVLSEASADIYVGGTTVTTANGTKLSTTDRLSIDLGPGDDLYAIATADTPTVKSLATRQ